MSGKYRKGDDTVGKPSSSSNYSIRVFRAYPLIEVRPTVPCRAIRGKGISVNSTLPPSQLPKRPRPRDQKQKEATGHIVYHTSLDLPKEMVSGISLSLYIYIYIYYIIIIIYIYTRILPKEAVSGSALPGNTSGHTMKGHAYMY